MSDSRQKIRGQIAERDSGSGQRIIAVDRPTRHHQHKRSSDEAASVLARLTLEICVERLDAAREGCPVVMRSQRLDKR